MGKKSTLLFFLISIMTASLLLFSCSGGGDGDGDEAPPEEEAVFTGALVVRTLGDLPEPSDENAGQLYFVINEGKFYYSNGSEYIYVDLSGPAGTAGDAGATGSSINWLGSLTSAPANPQVNDAYYNSSDGIAYLWDGDSWEVLARDGENAISLNESGMIGPGEALVLDHNLDRDDLTFSGQFVKNSFLYDYSEYPDLFGEVFPRAEEDFVFNFSSSNNAQTAITRTGVNDMVLAYTWDYGGVAYAYLDVYAYDSQSLGWEQSGDTIKLGEADQAMYSGKPVGLTTLTDGKIAAADCAQEGGIGVGDYYFYYDIFTPGGTTPAYSNRVYGTDKDHTEILDVGTLEGGNFVVAYDSWNGLGYYGYFNVYYGYGDPVTIQDILSPDFSGQYANNLSEIAVAPLKNGNFAVAYNQNGANGYFDVYRPNGSYGSQTTTIQFVAAATTQHINVAGLKNGSFVIGYSDGSKGEFVIYNNGDPSLVSPPVQIAGPVTFYEGSTEELEIVSLASGDFVILMEYSVGEGSYGIYKVYDEGGNFTGDSGQFYDNYPANISAAELRDNSFGVFYIDAEDGLYESYFNVYAEPVLLLERIDEDTVRLWNYTDETLELILSVNQ